MFVKLRLGVDLEEAVERVCFNERAVAYFDAIELALANELIEARSPERADPRRVADRVGERLERLHLTDPRLLRVGAVATHLPGHPQRYYAAKLEATILQRFLLDRLL